MISGEFISLISNVQWSIGLLCHSGFPAHQNVVVLEQNIPHSVQSFIFSKTENPDANVMKRSKKQNFTTSNTSESNSSFHFYYDL